MNLPKISITRPSFSPRFFIYFVFGLVLLVLIAEGAYYYGLPKIVPLLFKRYRFDWRSRSFVAPKEKVVKEESIFTYVKYPVGDGTQESQKIVRGVVKEINGDKLIIRVDNGEEIRVKYKDINRDIWIESGEAWVEMGKLGQVLPGDRIELSGISEGNEVDLTVEYLVVERL